ncbi:hypothetical protein HNP38_002744 [Chryseobacterium defluvii]|uniref:Uncharacterized protein n=1 Tax=Chryseobacterium defluvii TaxID=160396 RepID=A0A840KHE3_9FLAO|nr:hypothetical protein [Chryseobacterium defluvii]MBB4807438.1 hypothetical protein [Chryseobacterium defluvii]
MKLKEFLERNPIINSAQLAKEMWSDNKSAPSKLTNKLNENIVGNGKQRITEKDMEMAEVVLKKLADDIYKSFQ